MKDLTPREMLNAFDEGLEEASRLVRRTAARGKKSLKTEKISRAGVPADRAVGIRRMHGNTLVETLRKRYGKDFAPGYRSDTKLQTLLEREGFETVDQYLSTRGGAKQGKGRQ